MPKTLVIVESPTKAKTISKFLGTDYVVESSFGHVRDLPKSNMGIDIEGGTFEPTYRVSAEKTKQVKKLKDLAEKCGNQIIFATDEDREGEAISWHLAHILKVDPAKAKRIVFHEITKSAITEAIENPRGIDQKLVDAQQARRVLDRIVGYELSPFLWKKVSRGLSAGRVQSVAVRLIVERELEREAFNPVEYWSLEGDFFEKSAPESLLRAKLSGIDETKLDKLSISKKEEIDEILKDLENTKYKITNIEGKEGKRNPAPPFRTSTLQQSANQRFGFSSRQTMRVAQQLYEGINIGKEGQVGLITYMRTDSTNLSSKFIGEANNYIKKEFGNNYSISEPRVFSKKTKGAQEAHEAIRPTVADRSPESIREYLDEAQFKLYSLIWNRSVATQMAAAVLNKMRIEIETSESKKTYKFHATGQTIKFDGWLKLYPKMTKEEALPPMNEGDALTCKELFDEQHFTQPPARYSDATLIKTLEELGIGRPSTYAPTIATIEARKYVAKDDNRKFYPLDIARIVNEVLVEHFSSIVDFNFTALMEDNLDEIAEGKKDWKPIISTFYHEFHDNLVKKTDEVTREEVSHMRELGTDPKTGKPVYVRIGRYGPFVQLGSKDDEEKPRFASLEDGQIMQTITMDEAMVLLSLPRTLGQDEDGQDIKANKGRFGPYIQIGKEYFSIKNPELSPYTITLEEAKEVIGKRKEEKAKKVIKKFDVEGIQILRGPYGPYITDGTKNARVPKVDTGDEEDLEKKKEIQAEAAAKLTLEECKKLLEEAPARGRRGAKKAPAKTDAKKKATKKTTKKAPAKKATKKSTKKK